MYFIDKEGINVTELVKEKRMKEIIKKKNSLKRAGEEVMLIRIAGEIRKKEILVEGENQKTFLYIEDPEILAETF